MKKIWSKKRWYLSGLAAFALGGCVTNTQLMDFFRTEVARVTGGVVGQLYLLQAQSTAAQTSP